MTWNRSNSLHSSSSKSLLFSSSESSSSWTELSVDSYDECGGMGSGSHSSTIERLYAWEKKLYEEVKVSRICKDWNWTFYSLQFLFESLLFLSNCAWKTNIIPNYKRTALVV